MLDISVSIYSFSIRKLHARKNNTINLNESLTTEKNNLVVGNAYELFFDFFSQYTDFDNNKFNKKLFKATSMNDKSNCGNFTTETYLIESGGYGISSEILSSETKKLVHNLKQDEASVMKFHVVIAIPHDRNNFKVKKGLMLFQNVGSFGVMTITTQYIKRFFSEKYDLSIDYYIASKEQMFNLFVQKQQIKEIRLITNYNPANIAEAIDKGYGSEIKILQNFSNKEKFWIKMLKNFKHISDSKSNTIEFESVWYNNIKLVVNYGGRDRTINLKHLNTLAIIESLPEGILMDDGNLNYNEFITAAQNILADYIGKLDLS